MTQKSWDEPLSEGLREEAIKLFKDDVEVGKIRFQRSITPPYWKGKLWAITFSDWSGGT